MNDSNKTPKIIQLDEAQYAALSHLSEIEINGRVFRFPYRAMRALTLSEFNRLLADIQQHGVIYKIIADQDGNVIDGKYRLLAAFLLKLDVAVSIRPKLTTDQKEAWATNLNFNRRQLTKTEVKDVILRLKKEGRSCRQIAEALNVSRETVRTTDKTLSDEFPKRIVGKDGRSRPAHVYRSCVSVKSINEFAAASNAIKSSDPDRLPNKTIDLKRLERIARENKTEQLRQQTYEDVRTGTSTLLLGDFRVRGSEIDSESISLMLTDPPYAKEFLPLWNDLGALAQRVLKPGGIMLTYTGNLYLPDILQMLGKHLQYVWCLAILHSGQKKVVYPVNINQAWKFILWYCKPPMQIYWSPFADIFSGGQEKEHHKWQQSVAEAKYYLKALCPAGGTVLDPMMGSGTVVLAAMQLGFNATGIEIDPAAFSTAQDRIRKAEHVKEEGGSNV
jgi:ParB-like chromosome segregation protein Spo0J